MFRHLVIGMKQHPPRNFNKGGISLLLKTILIGVCWRVALWVEVFSCNIFKIISNQCIDTEALIWAPTVFEVILRNWTGDEDCLFWNGKNTLGSAFSWEPVMKITVPYPSSTLLCPQTPSESSLGCIWVSQREAERLQQLICLNCNFSVEGRLDSKHPDSQTRVFEWKYQHNAPLFPFRNVFMCIFKGQGSSKDLSEVCPSRSKLLLIFCFSDFSH